jgi:2-(1,2-epoxy-1,2-dihydrophenyl)acetyl-CoA isomerase
MNPQNRTTVNVRRDERVARIELHRPDAMNAIDTVMKAELLDALEQAARDPDVGAVVLTGAGTAFCTGTDLKTAAAADGDDARRIARTLLYDYQPILDLIVRMDKPVIAAVNGAAAGMGLSLALACDLLVMSERAYLLSPFIGIGLIPDGGAAWFLTQRLGYGRAFEIVADGRRIGAGQCLAWGLANRVVDGDALDATALKWAGELAAKAPLAMALTKRVARLSLSSGLAEVLGAEADLQALCYASGDSREARSAFIEKRKPQFGKR